jgi:hypothetical protein
MKAKKECSLRRKMLCVVIPEPGARRRLDILRRGDEMSKKAALIRVSLCSGGVCCDYGDAYLQSGAHLALSLRARERENGGRMLQPLS